MFSSGFHAFEFFPHFARRRLRAVGYDSNSRISGGPEFRAIFATDPTGPSSPSSVAELLRRTGVASTAEGGRSARSRPAAFRLRQGFGGQARLMTADSENMIGGIRSRSRTSQVARAWRIRSRFRCLVVAEGEHHAPSRVVRDALAANIGGKPIRRWGASNCPRGACAPPLSWKPKPALSRPRAATIRRRASLCVSRAESAKGDRCQAYQQNQANAAAADDGNAKVKAAAAEQEKKNNNE